MLSVPERALAQTLQPQPAQPKVCVLGASLGTGNRGVSALAASLVKLVLKACPGAEVKLLLGHRDAVPFQLSLCDGTITVPVVNCRMSPRSSWRSHLAMILGASVLYRLLPFQALRQRLAGLFPWIRAVTEADLVGDIRGGDSFSDIYGVQRFVVGSLPILTCIWVKGKVVQFPQTYGPFRSRIATLLARYILKHSTRILSRDRESIEEVRSLSHGRQQAAFCCDVAFSLDPIAPRDWGIVPELVKSHGECLFGLNVNGLMYNGGYTRQNMFNLQLDYPRFLHALVLEVLKDPSNRLLLVPHTFAPPESVESDPAACRRLMESLPEPLRSRVHLVTTEHDQSQIKAVIGRCDFFVGSRMHSCIAALSQGIPTVGVAYSKKFAGVFETVGMETWVVDGRCSTHGEAVACIMGKFRDRQAAVSSLRERVTKAKDSLSEVFHELLSAAQAPNSPTP